MMAPVSNALAGILPDTPVRFAAVSHVFEVLRVPATIHCYVPLRGHDWWPLHNEAVTMNDFELDHGLERERAAYNQKNFAELEQTKRLVRSEYYGFWNVFAPVVVDDQVVASLVTGPFSTRRLSSKDVLERFWRLSGREGDLGDPEFASYLSACLDTLVLSGKRLEQFERLLECLASLIAGQPPLFEKTFESYELRLEVERARDDELMWRTVKAMVDERTAHRWQSFALAFELASAGMSRAPDHVLVALASGPPKGVSAVERVVTMDALQRSCVELARSLRDTLAGQLGDYGLVFVSAGTGSAERQQRKALDLAERARVLARQRFGISLHFGVGSVQDGSPLDRAYWGALRAAEAAFTQDKRVFLSDDMAPEVRRSLHQQRKELAIDLEQRPAMVSARFERYLEAVAANTGYNLDSARGHLAVVFEMLTDTLTNAGALDESSDAGLREAALREAGSARTLQELFAGYRRAVAGVADAVQRPIAARHDQKLRAAVQLIQQRYAEPLSLRQAARVAGFNVSYFSRLFKEREHLTFSAYLSRFRLERAKQLLLNSELRVARVAELCGFRSLSYFSRSFRAALGQTPAAYRKTPRPAPKVAKKRPKPRSSKFIRKAKKLPIKKSR